MIEAMKEQQRQIEELKARLEAFENGTALIKPQPRRSSPQPAYNQ